MKLKKVVSAALVAALSVGLLAGCGGNAETNADAEAKVYYSAEDELKSQGDY